MLRAAVVGFGNMGRNHARVLSSLQGVELVAVADERGHFHGLSKEVETYTSAELLDNSRVDFAVVATPTSTHTSVAKGLLGRGVHVLVEKPLSDTVEGAAELVEACEMSGLVGAVGHIERFSPAVNEMHKLIFRGDIGGIIQIATRRLGSFSGRIQDVGVASDLATHDIDIASFVGGSSYARVSGESLGGLVGSHEDLVAVTGRLKNGIIVNHLVNWLTPFKERCVVVTGEHGVLVADTVKPDLSLFEKSGPVDGWTQHLNKVGAGLGRVVSFGLPLREPLRLELEGFRDVILGGAGDTVSFSEGAHNVAVAKLILRSALENKVMLLD